MRSLFRALRRCNLGYINLDYFAPKKKGGRVDLADLVKAHRLMTRFLIRVIYGKCRPGVAGQPMVTPVPVTTYALTLAVYGNERSTHSVLAVTAPDLRDESPLCTRCLYKYLTAPNGEHIHGAQPVISDVRQNRSKLRPLGGTQLCGRDSET
ncbi:hypothetical protein [Streptomyces sp. NPDC005009]